VSEAIETARQICERRQLKLTPIRQRVLELVWNSHEPIGAYDILAQLDPGTAPPTVYRALEFLLAAGLVHRIDTLNAFIGCDRAGSDHVGQLLICSRCQRVAEIDDDEIGRALGERARALGFRLENHLVEIKGLCPECQQAAHPDVAVAD